MSTIQTGAWRRGADGEFKVFIRGCEQQAETKVEIITRAGNINYTVIIGTYTKISGGYLYNFYRTGKPKDTPTQIVIPVDASQPRTRSTGAEVSVEELDEALGLTR